MTAETADLQRLLVHADWLRALARRLVGPSSADDVVQETLIAAMQSPPDADRPPRPWLARVMRNVTRMRFRAESRRERREDAAIDVREPIVPETAVQRLETHRALCELVLGLDEPFRQTLVRHYFDGLTLAAIARADGLPEGTVRWRHKTALDRLRARLDERAGGDRRAWVAGLGPLVAAPKTSPLVVGGILVNKVVIGSVIAVAGGLVVWGVSSGHASAPAPSDIAAAGAATRTGAPASPAVARGSSVPAIPRHALQLPSAIDRQRIAERIAAARATHQAQAQAQAATTTPAPSLADAPVDLDKEVIRGAMREVLPFIQDCYEQALPTMKSTDLDIKAHLILTGDPDVGTLIDADKLVDAHGVPLGPKLDDCLRSTFQTLELPPIGDGDRIDVTYPFMFRQAPDPGSEPSPATPPAK